MSFNIYLVIAVVIVVATVIYFFQVKPAKKTSLKDLYSEGLDLLVTGRLKDAYRNFRTLVQKDTNNIKAYLKLGQAAREGGNPSQALKIHSSLIIRKNLTQYERIELYKNLALDHAKLGDLNAAIEKVHTILKYEKGNEWALTHLVKFYRENQDWAKAGEYLALLQKTLGREDKHKLALYKTQEGKAMLDQKNFVDAREKFDEALKMWNSLGVAHYLSGNTYSTESELAYIQAEKIKKKSPKSAANQKKYDEAMDRAKSLLAKAVSNWIKFTETDPEQAWLVLPKLKDALFALGRYDEIESILKTILSKDGDNTEALAALADFYNNKGDNHEAIELIESAMEKDDQSLVTHLIRLKLKLNKPELRKLSAEVDKVIEIASSDKYIRYRQDDRSDLRWLNGSIDYPDKPNE
ncbi:MAG: tetratricopeptide repeat protein [FCB group bacterium]|nr:tetratricopeptide repeat protein [FCB group bacterium]